MSSDSELDRQPDEERVNKDPLLDAVYYIVGYSLTSGPLVLYGSKNSEMKSTRRFVTIKDPKGSKGVYFFPGTVLSLN